MNLMSLVTGFGLAAGAGGRAMLVALVGRHRRLSASPSGPGSRTLYPINVLTDRRATLSYNGLFFSVRLN
jgi:hypothetical protein